MDGSKSRLIIATFCAACCVLMLNQLNAAEKVKFGTAKGPTAIQTQPVSTIESELPDPISNGGNVNVAVPPRNLPTGPTTVLRPENEDEGQENWIFNDTQSAKGIQRALGVEVYETETSTGEAAAPTSAVEQYFDRQKNLGDPQTTPGGWEELDGFDNSLGNFGRRGFGNSSLNSSEASNTSISVGNGGFKKTLNSPNPSIRSYYRNLYKNQLTPSQPVVPALEAADLINRQEREDARTRQLFNRAAMIESMTPKGPASVFDDQQTGLQSPTVIQREQRLSTPMLERRGGKTVIPSRPF